MEMSKPLHHSKVVLTLLKWNGVPTYRIKHYNEKFKCWSHIHRVVDKMFISSQAGLEESSITDFYDHRRFLDRKIELKTGIFPGSWLSSTSLTHVTVPNNVLPVKFKLDCDGFVNK